MADKTKPRVLIVTPEVTYLPLGMGKIANDLSAKAGGLADVSAALVSALHDQGGDVHIALPDYRSIFGRPFNNVFEREYKKIKRSISNERIHLAEDRAFYYLDQVYSSYGTENSKLALAFQREVMNNIIPKVQPDLIHCNDWMTGLIPAMARVYNIPCLFTVHNIHTVRNTMAEIEDRGIDAASFWYNLYFEKNPHNYEESRNTNFVDYLASGVFASHYVNTVSMTFLDEIVSGMHPFIKKSLRSELINKANAGCALGILNAPDSSFNPEFDGALKKMYNPNNHVSGKRENKKHLQKKLGLIQDENAPLFFWPSRLDNIQKGCDLFAEIIYDIMSAYWSSNLQVVFVADGEYKKHFYDIMVHHGFDDRIALCGFDEELERLAYAASDFTLMPSKFEPCGLPQMVGSIYGALPLVHDTGGLHDTVTELDVDKNLGNGFLFENYDSTGFRWSIDQAMNFHTFPAAVKNKNRKRIMKESREKFTHKVTAKQYIDLYEKMLERPFIN